MAGLREPGPAFYAGLVGHIYEAALDAARWHDVLASLETLYPEARITLFGHRTGRPGGGFAVHRNFAEDDLRAYFAHFIYNSPYIARVDRCVVGRPSCSEQMIRDDELFRTEHYHDFVRPRRLGHYATGVLLERTPSATTALSIADRRDDAARRAHQIRTLGLLAPHLQRAMQLQAAVARERTAAVAMQAVFDRWAHAAFVLDASRRLLVMNGAAARLLDTDCGIELARSGHLRVRDARHDAALEEAVRRQARLGELDLSAGEGLRHSFALPRPAPHPPLQAMT